MEILRAACRDHVAKLLPVKFERMSGSPCTFYRGAVEIMAADLGAWKHTRIEAQICGDAHLKNFGFYATPGLEIMLDINDFDQTIRGPWEWDVKRCATSIVLAGRVAGDSEGDCKEAARLFLEEYAGWIHAFAEMPALEVARHRALRSSGDPVIPGPLQEAARSTPLANLKKLNRGTAQRGYPFRRERNLILEGPCKNRKPHF